MNTCSSSHEEIDAESPLQRITNTRDFPALLLEHPRTSNDTRQSHRSNGCSSNIDPENSDAIYMTVSKEANRRHYDSSSTRNDSDRRLVGRSDRGANRVEDDIFEDRDERSKAIIEREIFEWQYVCHTGRPYWWSPAAKLSRLERARPKIIDESASHVWNQDIEDCPKAEYNPRRRAVSDSFLADPSMVEDMAHMIAVQLLGSCFTLPPDLLVPATPEVRKVSGKIKSPKISDPRMISSLRMHTKYRYSPCFGHQGRDTSPVQLWPGMYDGPSRGSTPSVTATGMQTPVIGTSNTLLRLHRVHRALHVTEGSAANCSLDSHADDNLKSCGTNFSRLETAQVGRLGVNDSGPRSFAGPHISMEEIEEDTDQAPTIEAPPQQQAGPHQKLGGLTFPMILEEANQPFVQPVKELVVKKWRTLRRRFGGSLHSHLPGSGSEELWVRSTSTSKMDGSGKERRRRAQASGNISNSYESTPHYNSPESCRFSPDGSGMSSPTWAGFGKASPGLTLIDPLTVEESPARTDDTRVSALAQDPTLPNASSLTVSHGPRPWDAPNTAPEGGLFRPEAGPALELVSSPAVSSPLPAVRQSRVRQRTKSMLSELFTADDLADETVAKDRSGETGSNIVATGGNSLPLPRKKTKSASDMIFSQGSIGVLGSPDVAVKVPPRLSRTSTSGTQIFIPSVDGVEVDGLPVGPSKHMWDGLGKRRERSYL